MAVVTQVINDGPRNYSIHLDIALANTNAVIIDSSAIAGIDKLYLHSAQWSLTGAGAQIFWDQTANERALEMTAGEDHVDYSKIGGIPNPEGAGTTGDVLLTNLIGLTSGTAVLCFKKS